MVYKKVAFFKADAEIDSTLNMKFSGVHLKSEETMCIARQRN